MRTRILLAALAACTGISAARGQIVLQMKFPPGASYRQSQSVVIDQFTSEGTVDRKTRSAQRFVVGVDNGKPTPEGVTPVRITTEEMRMDMDLPDGSKVSFDSTQPPPESDNPVFELVGQLVQSMIGARLTYLVDAQRQVVGVEGVESIVDRAPPEAAPVLQQQLDPQRLARRFEEEINRLPAKAVRPGETWHQPYELDLDAGQRMVFERYYQYVGPVKDSGGEVHEIRIKDTAVQYELVASEQSPITLRDSQLKVLRSGGRMLFNSKLGRVVEANMSTRVAGELTLSLGRGELAQRLDLTFINSSATEDKAPDRS